MAIKKYTSGAWVPTIYRKYGTETENITSFPAQIIGDGQPITSCQISGNTLQDGTPTPEDPVEVVGCGVMTENLFDGRLQQGYYAYNTGWYTLSDTYVCTHLIPCTENTTYTFRCINTEGGSKNYGYVFFNSARNRIGSDYIDAFTKGDVVTHTATTPQNTAFLAIDIAYGRRQANVVRPSDITDFVLNTGYKLPLTVNGTEYPIYLGQVPTTRKIYKMRLVNPLSSTQASNGYRLTFNSSHPALPYQSGGGVCNIARWNGNYNQIGFVVTGKDVFITQNVSEWATKDSATRWFEENEVYIWYVLATPETGIVNEPLMKIGDYADTVTATNIPTTGIPETFDVQTTLKPSEVQLTYHGWHEHDDTKYTQGE